MEQTAGKQYNLTRSKIALDLDRQTRNQTTIILVYYL